jgi:hypothetical protein
MFIRPFRSLLPSGSRCGHWIKIVNSSRTTVGIPIVILNGRSAFGCH